MAYAPIPLSGYIAHGFRRRAQRRRSLPPQTIIWSNFASVGYNITLDLKSAQYANQIDMIQSVKWDNPIGAAVWLQSDSGDLVKIPPYSSGSAPILVGEGDTVSLDLDPSSNVVPTTNQATTLTFMSVPSELTAYANQSAATLFLVPGFSNLPGVWTPGTRGYAVTGTSPMVALPSAGVAVLFRLPRVIGSGITTVSRVTITGFDLFFASTATGALDVNFSSTPPANNGIEFSFGTSFAAAGSALNQVSVHGANNSTDNIAPLPSIEAHLNTTLTAGLTLQVGGSVDLVIQP
jgi:hypothetical protein